MLLFGWFLWIVNDWLGMVAMGWTIEVAIKAIEGNAPDGSHVISQLLIQLPVHLIKLVIVGL